MLAPEVLAEVERRFAKAMRRRKKPNPKEAAQLQTELDDLVAAISAGQRRDSPEALEDLLAGACCDLIRSRNLQD